MRSGWTFGSRRGPAGRDASPAELSAFTNEDFGAHTDESDTDDESRDAHQPPGDRRKPELGRDCDQRSWRTADELGGREFRRQALAAQRVQRAAGGDTPGQLDQREQTLHEAGERVAEQRREDGTEQHKNDATLRIGGPERGPDRTRDPRGLSQHSEDVLDDAGRAGRPIGLTGVDLELLFQAEDEIVEAFL